MHRVLTVVEGFTERAIVEQTLAPYLGARGLSLHAKVIGKPGHKGGVRSFEAVRKEILALLKQERTLQCRLITSLWIGGDSPI